MSDASQTAVKPSLAYAKIVATPTLTAWSQVYNAGSLFACLSLTKTEEGETSLQTLGKEIFNNLEAEFFTLEQKNLTSIKDALTTSFASLPDTVQVSLALAYFLDGILYIFLKGAGKIVMKREGSVGILLSEQDEQTKQIHTASGYLQHADCIILQTKQFADDIDEPKLATALELSLPNDIAEALSLDIHAKEDGGQAAVIVVYQGTSKVIEPDEELGAVVEKEREEHEMTSSFEGENIAPTISTRPHPKLSFPTIRLPHVPSFRFNKTRKLYLVVIIVIVLLLTFSIISTKQKQNQVKIHQQFEAVYPQAQKYISDAVSLKTLRPDESRDDFKRAEELLTNALPHFPTNSQEYKQLASLLHQAQSELGSEEQSPSPIKAQKANVDATDMLGYEKGATAVAFTQDGQNIYYLTSKSVISLSKTDGQKKTLVTNDNDWSEPKSMATYQGNIYVLDTKNTIVKFVPSDNTFTKSSYFTGLNPDFSQSVDLAIDSSIYVLFSDGSIQKYTKGQKDSFTITHLTQPFIHPIQIFTDATTNALYILDPTHSRVVKLSKDGSFQAQYVSPLLKEAKDIEVNEKDNNIFFLSSGSVWELSMQ